MPSSTSGSRRFLGSLSAIFAPGLCEPGGKLVLSEPRNEGDPGVVLHRSGPVLAIRLDALDNKTRFPYLDAKRPKLTSVCDYVVIGPPRRRGGRVRVLLIELKTGKTDGAFRQIANGKLLTDWFLSVAAHHEGLDVAEPIVRGVVFSKGPSLSILDGKRIQKLFDAAITVAGVRIVHLSCRQRELQLDTLLA